MLLPMQEVSVVPWFVWLATGGDGRFLPMISHSHVRCYPKGDASCKLGAAVSAVLAELNFAEFREDAWVLGVRPALPKVTSRLTDIIRRGWKRTRVGPLENLIREGDPKLTGKQFLSEVG